MEAAAPTVGVRVAQLAVPDVTAVERTIGAFAARPNRGLIVLANRTTIAHRQRIIALAAQYRLPAMYSYRYFVRIVAEVAHEALLRAWPRLREWLREERDFLVFKGEIERAAARRTGLFASEAKASQISSMLVKSLRTICPLCRSV